MVQHGGVVPFPLTGDAGRLVGSPAVAPPADAGPAAVAALRAGGVARADPVAVVAVPGAGVALAFGRSGWAGRVDPVALVVGVERAIGPRWVWWSAGGAGSPLAGGWRQTDEPGPALSWDLAAVHRILHGGHRDDPGAVWAAARNLPPPPPPRRARGDGQLDLLAMAEQTDEAGDPDDPVGPDGQLRPGWLEETLHGTGTGGVDARLARAARLARLALVAHAAQEKALRALPDRRPRPTRLPLAVQTARAQSAAEVLARELERRGLPIDRRTAETTIGEIIGPPPTGDLAEAAARRARDEPVLRHLDPSVDLRNPASVRSALATVGIDVPDTRSGRLRAHSAVHPVVDELLAWRKAERIATTYGYRWLATHVGADGRLRGRWHGSDGAAGRMTADAGLHNLPAELRVAVAAEPGHRFVRADLGQIEPRVLAVVSGDAELTRATRQDDLYAPIAARLGVDRPTAKVAVLAAMYGQTSGAAGQALRQLRQTYPVALDYLDAADAAGRAAALGRPPQRELRTFGGRRIPLRELPAEAEGDAARVAAWGRFARNAVVQGAAAELFKAWAVTVRQALVGLGGSIVLCLHDELLLQVPSETADAAATATRDALDATAAHWSAGSPVRFVADITVIARWSDAKP